ncbi:uncharacterized protein [Rutidosis leptorrhynchoides]|uniref:uncharacterized protein n=1 Tax=Rutidosis leptorrhynchoides TaxID=125765 RepID=UPI003A99EC75
MDFRYARPPQPPSSDPNQPPPPQQHQQPVPPPPGPWYSGQFQYHSPSPPPPQWPHQPKPPHSDHHLPPPPPYAAAAPPPPMPYSSNSYSLPPRPHVPPPQPPYPPVNQEWSNTGWGHQAWDYSGSHLPQNKNEDDWAAKARAWAASKAVTDDQHQNSQLGPVNRPGEMNYHDQYQQHSLPPSNYQQYSSFVPPPRQPENHLADPSSYATDAHFSYNGRDKNLQGPAAVYHHQETAPTSLSAHQQEVPSSYSSVAGKEEPRDTNGHFYQPSQMTYSSAPQHQVQPSISPNDKSILAEQRYYSFNNSSAESVTDHGNLPLDTGSRYGHDHGPFGQSATPGMAYPSMPPVYTTGQQADPLVGVPSPVSMHSTPLFGRATGSSFQPTMPSGNTTFPIGTSNAFHPTNAFPGDAYGFPDRPKKASMPNWLKEEIIKKKAVIGTSVPEFSRQETESNEDELDQPFDKEDQVDKKNMESARSPEKEDDDEDYVEAARAAAVNQEIKRILTEVLLKVTDELFDEIATKVLDEDNLNGEVEHKTIASSDIASAAITPKSSAKVLISAKTKGTNSDDASGKSSSGPPGDVLGLGSYASDDDDDDDEKEVQNSSIPSSDSGKPSIAENAILQVDDRDIRGKMLPEEGHSPRPIPNRDTADNSGKQKVKLESSDVSKSKLSGTGGLNTDYLLADEPQGGSSRNGLDISHKDKKDNKLDEDSKVHDDRLAKRAKREDQNGSKEKIKDRDSEKKVSKGEVEDHNGIKDKIKDRDSGKKVSKGEIKDNKKERDRDRRSTDKEEGQKRETGKNDKSERLKHKSAGDSGRHKRLHSPSAGGRGRSSKDSRSDSSSDDSRRKVHSKRRHSSPSPVRSRRQVSRSPPSKRSHHRHSTYSSLETTRERRRSRSRSRRG